MQKIIPFIWFDTQAEEAAAFYTGLFEKSKIGAILCYDEASSKPSGKPVGSVLTVDFKLNGQPFTAINGGTHFKLTPAVSFFVTCKTMSEFDRLWNGLVRRGTVLMERGKYPFSEQYGWLNDQFGVSWQLNMGKKSQQITPALLFKGKNFGKCKEAIKYYTKIFPKSKIVTLAPYEKGEGDVAGKIKYAEFVLAGVPFKAMESSYDHQFDFTGAISFVVDCKTQKEVDKYWKMSAVPADEQCGWMTDKYGVTWQIVPTILTKLLMSKDKAKAGRVMRAMMEMKKLNVAALQKAAKKK